MIALLLANPAEFLYSLGALLIYAAIPLLIIFITLDLIRDWNASD